MLAAPLTKDEIELVIDDLSLNKTPGIDGIPSEFYSEFWTEICDDMLDMYNDILQSGLLTKSQRKGIITIIAKNANINYLTNYRPITLLCVDYKILAKLICIRVRKILSKIIYGKQFCAVPGRNINLCNMELRDLIFYANENDLDLAVLNLDWYKAFDTVSIEFLLKILDAFGFGETFIGWISILYNGIESALTINNIVGEFFPVLRSVRQGCPLSMALFTIYQEPFYRSIVTSRIIRPLTLPGGIDQKLLGYADDTNVIIRDDRSVVEVINVIDKFESA